MKKTILLLAICFYFFQANAQDFTFGTIPDTQNLTQDAGGGDAWKINKITEWFVSTRATLNTSFVASLGDMTQWGASYQWEFVRNAYDEFTNSGMPYAPCQGNHDPDRDGYGMDTWFPQSEFEATSTFGGTMEGRMENAYYTFKESGMDFLVVVLETHDNYWVADNGYDEGSVAWANNIISQHPNHRTIFITHDFYNWGGAGNNGRRLIPELITKHDNLFLAICGHSCDDGGEKYWTETTPGGNTVHCIMSDYQCRNPRPSDGRGYEAIIRYYTFKPNENKIYVYTYDVLNKNYLTEASSQFTLDYNMEVVECTDPHQAYQNNVPTLPGTVEAENYNTGCPGVPFYDTDAVNNGGEYRTDAVDIEVCTNGGYNVGWIETGEWLNYQVSVTQSGTYNFNFEVASDLTGSIIHLEVDGVDVSGPISINTSVKGWQAWETTPAVQVQLTAGIQHIKIVVDQGGFNLDKFSASTDTPVEGFTIGIMPDTQNMSRSDSEANKIKEMTQFYIDRKASLNVHSVVSVGDMVYGYNSVDNIHAEYSRVKPAYDMLENAGIPYVPAMGNHDHDLSIYNTYFPVSSIEQQNPYYGGYFRGAENTYYLFSEGGIDFVMVVIETHDQFIIADHGYDYDMESIEWANGIFQSYPNRKGIFVTHDLFEPTGYNLIDDVIKQNDNLFMAVCGHSCKRPGFNGEITGEKHWVETSPTGNEVHCLLSNYQCDADNGATVRYYTIKPSEKKVYAYTYNVVSNQQLTDADSQFSFTFETNQTSAPVITNISKTPSSPTSSQAINVSAIITDDGTVSSATLNWGLSSSNLSNSISMNASGSSYSATIPGQNAGTVVYYQVTAVDNDNLQSSSTVSSVSVQGNGTGKVEVQGRDLYIDGVKYDIKGICYSTEISNIDGDIQLMKEANINTIRVYSPILEESTLDKFAAAGIKIIMGFGYGDPNHTYKMNDNSYRTYINMYKDHPAILMWEFGNEYNYHPEWFADGMNTWYAALNAAAEWCHANEPNHPVSTAHGEVPTVDALNACPAVDVWGMNLYRSDNDVPAITTLASRTNKAMYVAEAGGDSYNKIEGAENESDQARATRNILTGILGEDVCIGVTLFEFCDEWWKAGDPDVQNLGGSAPNSSGVPYDGSADEEYWGIVKRDRSKKAAFAVVKELYGNGNDDEILLPGLVEAENYSSMFEVQTEDCTEGGLNVGWIDDGDWMDYLVNVTEAGTYNVTFRIAADGTAQKSFEILAGSQVVGDVVFTATEGWQNWEDATTTVNLSAGIQTIRLKATSTGFNINWMNFTKGGDDTFSVKIEAEDFISMDGVVVDGCSEGGDAVGWIGAGDWMAYSVDIPSAGEYVIEYRVASLNGGGQVILSQNAQDIKVTDLPKTNGWQTWTTETTTAYLNAGPQTLVLYAGKGGWNINWWSISSGSNKSVKQNKQTSFSYKKELVDAITIYPNPTSRSLNIHTNMENYSIELFDLQGKQVFVKANLQNSSKTDVSNIRKGVYILKLRSSDKIHSKKLVIK